MLSLSLFLALIDNEDERNRFAAFYEKYRDYALGLAFSILKNTFSAEDAVQDAFEYLARQPWRMLDYEEESAKSFLMELVKDYSNNIIRKESKIQTIPLESIDNTITEEAFLEAMEKARIEDIREAVGMLDETNQAIVRLFYTYGFKTNEMVPILKLSDANIRKRLERSRAFLKNIIEKEEEAVYE